MLYSHRRRAQTNYGDHLRNPRASASFGNLAVEAPVLSGPVGLCETLIPGIEPAVLAVCRVLLWCTHVGVRI